MSDSQRFERHARWNPLFHFIASPILLVNLVMAVNALARAPGAATAWGAILAFGLYIGVAAGRTQALTVQNRLIRLEERLRLQRLLPAEMQGDIDALGVRELIALRFASDAELPALVRRVRTGEFSSPKEIKRAVREWRPDHLRA